MYWFTHLGVTTELNPWDAFTPGRLDQHPIPFYEKIPLQVLWMIQELLSFLSASGLNCSTLRLRLRLA